MGSWPTTPAIRPNTRNSASGGKRPLNGSLPTPGKTRHAQLLSRRTTAQKSALPSPQALRGIQFHARRAAASLRAPLSRRRQFCSTEVFWTRWAAFPRERKRRRLSKKWLPPLFRRSFMKFSPRFLMKLSAKISCEVSCSRHMSPKMTDFHLIPSSADDGTLRGFPFWEVFRHAEAFPRERKRRFL